MRAASVSPALSTSHRPRPPLAAVRPLRLADPAPPPAPEPAPLRAVIADGQRLIRAGLARLFDDQGDIAVAGEAACGEQLLALVGTVQADVVILDAELPGAESMALTRELTTRSPAIAVIVLIDDHDHDGDERLLAALSAGAAAVLTKDSDEPELLRAVRVVADGGATLSPHLTRRLIALHLSHRPRHGQPPPQLTELTPREREVMALVAAGLSNTEIAQTLVITPATAKTHVSRARQKLGARDRAQLVTYAYRTGLITTP